MRSMRIDSDGTANNPCHYELIQNKLDGAPYISATGFLECFIYPSLPSAISED